MSALPLRGPWAPLYGLVSELVKSFLRNHVSSGSTGNGYVPILHLSEGESRKG